MENTLTHRWILALTDDLTGGLEVGSKFAAQGLPAQLTSKMMSAQPTGPVFIIDTESRHLLPAEAAALLRKAASHFSAHEPWLVYKKTDSTLRGNIAAELEGLTSVFPERQVVYVPAYPAMGRTVSRGQLLVDGIPVHQTAFAADRLNPIHSSSVRSAIGSVPATILDGETDDDILAAARSICASHAPVLVAGPAAIAAALSAVLPFARMPVPLIPPLRRCLVVNGSMHPASLAQVEQAAREGLLNGQWNLFEFQSKESGMERAVRLGKRVKREIEDNPVDAIIVFGGDTSYGIHAALGAPEFTCCGDILPGLPVSRTGDLYWITKAGGFGPANVLAQLRQVLVK